MAQANISLFSTTIVDSYSSQDTAYPWSNLLDGKTDTNARSAIAHPEDQWIIIDLGSIWPLTGFKLLNSTFSTSSYNVNTYKIDISATGTAEGDFIEVVPETYIFSTDPLRLPPPGDGGIGGGGGGFGGIGSSISAIPPTDARYIRLQLLTNQGNALYVAASEFEIYSLTIEQITTQILSDALIFFPTETKAISSDAFIIHPVYTDKINVTSDAEITINRSEILSDARIVDKFIYSDAHIISTDPTTIVSDAYIYRSDTIATDLLFFGQANETSESVGTFIYAADQSSSDEVIVNDMMTGPVMDMTTISPPLGYNNYDWKYDWVVRTFNKCQYKFEVRSADNLSSLYSDPFQEIALGQQIYKGQVAKFHQWRCHVWASGSGDFELHQFTIKGYIDYPANPIYRALRERPFISTSHVRAPGDSFTVQQYEPPPGTTEWKGTYIPGDLDGDWDIDQLDANLIINYIFAKFDESPAPGAAERSRYNDSNKIPSVNDAIAVLNYINSAGPPPRRFDEPA